MEKQLYRCLYSIVSIIPKKISISEKKVFKILHKDLGVTKIYLRKTLRLVTSCQKLAKKEIFQKNLTALQKSVLFLPTVTGG